MPSKYPWTIELGTNNYLTAIMGAETFREALTIAIGRTRPGSMTHETWAEIILESAEFRALTRRTTEEEKYRVRVAKVEYGKLQASRSHYGTYEKWYTILFTADDKVVRHVQVRELHKAVKRVIELSKQFPNKVYRFCRNDVVLGFFKEGKCLKIVHFPIKKPPPIPADACVRPSKPNMPTAMAATAPSPPSKEVVEHVLESQTDMLWT